MTGTTRAIRVYADTSVFGGVFDEEYVRASTAFFAGVRRGRFHLVVSPVVEDELSGAPPRVQAFFREMLPWTDRAELTEDALELRQAFVRAGIVGRRSMADALHVAVATVSACGVLVSWNCRHIVNFQRIPMYNAISRANGWGQIAIHTPLEVVNDEDEDI